MYPFRKILALQTDKVSLRGIAMITQDSWQKAAMRIRSKSGEKNIDNSQSIKE